MAIHPVILNVESTEYSHQVSVRASVFHGFGNVTGAYVAAFEAGTVVLDPVPDEDLKAFMTTNRPNLLHVPIEKYDQHTLETVVETAYTAIDAAANVDVDTDTKGYDICVLAVGYNSQLQAETRSFTFYKNDPSTHPETVSLLPGFVSGSVSINNAFVEQGSVRAERRLKGQTIPVETAAATAPVEELVIDTTQFAVTNANVALQDGGETTNYAYVFGSTGDRPLTLYERLDFMAGSGSGFGVQKETIGGGAGGGGTFSILGTGLTTDLDVVANSNEAVVQPWDDATPHVVTGDLDATVIDSATGTITVPSDGNYMIVSRHNSIVNSSNRANPMFYFQTSTDGGATWIEVSKTRRSLFSRRTDEPYGTVDHYVVLNLTANEQVRQIVVGQPTDQQGLSDVDLGASQSSIDLIQLPNTTTMYTDIYNATAFETTSTSTYTSVSWSNIPSVSRDSSNDLFTLLSDNNTLVTNTTGNYLIIVSAQTKNTSGISNDSRVTSVMKCRKYDGSSSTWTDIPNTERYMYNRTDYWSTGGAQASRDSGTIVFIENFTNAGDGIQIQGKMDLASQPAGTPKVKFEETNMVAFNLNEFDCYAQYNKDGGQDVASYVDLTWTTTPVIDSGNSPFTFDGTNATVTHAGTYMVFASLTVACPSSMNDRVNVKATIKHNGISLDRSTGYTYSRGVGHLYNSTTLYATVSDVSVGDTFAVNAGKIEGVTGVDVHTNNCTFVIVKVPEGTGVATSDQPAQVITGNIETALVEAAYTDANVTLPAVPVLNVYDSVRDQIVPASAVNTGYVYVVGTNSNDLANISNIEAGNRFNTQTAFVPVTPLPDRTMDSRGCVRFNQNGTTNFQQYLKLKQPARWNLDWTAESFTIAFWIKVRSDDSSTVRKVFSLGDTNVPEAVFEVTPSSGGGGSITFGGITFNGVTGITADNTWHHVLMTRDQTFTLYVDNTAIASTTGTFGLSGLVSNAPIRIGKGNDSTITTDHMKHTELDDFVVYKGHAFDANQVNSVYTQGPEHVYATDNYETVTVADPHTPAVEPYAFWKFEPGDELLGDTSDNNNHLKKWGLNLDTANVIESETANLQSDTYDAFVDDPYIVLANVETNTTTNTLDVLEGSLFSGFADIERYHVFAFDTSNVAESDLTRANVTLFAETHLVSADLPDGHSNVSGVVSGNLVYSGSNVPRYGVELLNNNVQLTHAFNSLLDSSSVVPITTSSTYKPFVYAKDSTGRTIGTAAEPDEIAAPPTGPPIATHWRFVFLGGDSGSSTKFLTTTGATPDYYNYGIRSSGLWRLREGQMIDLGAYTQPLPSTIDESEITDVVLNDTASGYYPYGLTHDDKDIFYESMDKYIYMTTLDSSMTTNYKNEVLTVDGVYYDHAVVIDVEFSSPKSINEFMFRGHSKRANLPYILKIDYSFDGTQYVNDAIYVRETTPTNPEWLSLSYFVNANDYMVLQRTDGTSWSDSVSISFT